MFFEIKEKNELKAEIRKLKEEKMDLEYQKKMEVEEIKHLNRLAQEKRDIELDREKNKLLVEYNKKVEALNEANRESLTKKMEEYHQSTVNNLKDFNNDMKETTLSIYKDIIARLPNVNVKMVR